MLQCHRSCCTIIHNVFYLTSIVFIIYFVEKIFSVLRIKRENQTFFITTTKSNSIRSIKEEISKAANHEVQPDKMRLYLPDDEEEAATSSNTDSSSGKAGGYIRLPDEALLSDHDEKIQNDSILYVVFRKKGMEDAAGEDEFGELDKVWEDVNILQPQQHES